MRRYIDADALKSRMFNYYECVNENTSKSGYKGETLMNYEVADMIEDCIDNAHIADVVEVVRCKDCMWWHTKGCAFRNDCTDDLPSAEDFCSQATRKRIEQ